MGDPQAVFAAIRPLLKAYRPPLVPKTDTERYLDLWSVKPLVIAGRKRKEVFFAGLIMSNGVGSSAPVASSLWATRVAAAADRSAFAAPNQPTQAACRQADAGHELAGILRRGGMYRVDSPAANEPIVVPVKEFLLTEQRCPSGWRSHDLYLCRDEAVVFYVGQSYAAFDQVWQHIVDGFKGRSVLGRFILCNWPTSMRFIVELHDSRSAAFASVGHDLDAAERALIERVAPCFNEQLNRCPTPLPQGYAPPGRILRCSRSLAKLIGEARRAVQADRRKSWLADPTSETS